MNNYLLLCKKIKQMNLENTSILSNEIIDEYQSDFNFDTFASEKKTISKDDFIFNFIIVKHKLPRKNSDSNHLNYSMQKKYCSYLFVDHVTMMECKVFKVAVMGMNGKKGETDTSTCQVLTK